MEEDELWQLWVNHIYEEVQQHLEMYEELPEDYELQEISKETTDYLAG